MDGDAYAIGIAKGTIQVMVYNTLHFILNETGLVRSDFKQENSYNFGQMTALSMIVFTLTFFSLTHNVFKIYYDV